MNAKAKETDLLLVNANHEKALAALRRDVLAEIFAELVRLHHSGHITSATLQPNHISVYVHVNGNLSNCKMFTAFLNSADELIGLLKDMERITMPTSDLEEASDDDENV